MDLLRAHSPARVIADYLDDLGVRIIDPRPPAVVGPEVGVRSRWLNRRFRCGPCRQVRPRLHIDAHEFRACVEPLEALFFADRNSFYQGLLHLVVALLQLQRGMIRGPRIRLASAAALLAPYAPWHRGVDVAGLLASIQACEARLP